MSYFAGHMKKLKREHLKGMQIHNQREKESRTNRDIDKQRSKENYDLANEQPLNYGEAIQQRIKEGADTKPKKNATLCNSWVITSDKGFFDRIGEAEEKRFFEESYKWFCDRYGKENVAFAMVHKDEHTPHMHLGVIPITKDRRLSGKDVFNRQELRAVQGDFPKFIQSKGFDLERGIPSNQKHVEPVRWKNQQLRMEEQRLEKKIGKMSEIEKEAKSIFDMKAKEVTFFGLSFSDQLRVEKGDWESLKGQAVEVVRLRADNQQLRKENRELRNHIIEGNRKRESLGQELGLYKGFAKEKGKEFDMYKERSKEKEKSLKIDRNTLK